MEIRHQLIHRSRLERAPIKLAFSFEGVPADLLAAFLDQPCLKKSHKLLFAVRAKMLKLFNDT